MKRACQALRAPPRLTGPALPSPGPHTLPLSRTHVSPAGLSVPAPASLQSSQSLSPPSPAPLAMGSAEPGSPVCPPSWPAPVHAQPRQVPMAQGCPAPQPGWDRPCPWPAQHHARSHPLPAQGVQTISWAKLGLGIKKK